MSHPRLPIDYEKARREFVGSLTRNFYGSTAFTKGVGLNSYKNFLKRKVPTIDDLERQMAQRFGILFSDWNITLINSIKTQTDPDYSRTVKEFNLVKLENTKIEFKSGYVYEADGTIRPDFEGGFTHNKMFYPVNGWVAYAKEPDKDDLMAGIRIYCRGKIAAQTNIFNRKAGFTGEYDIRSYLIGEIQADWLDEKEDLIQTDRREILWSHELGQAFEEWGQKVVAKLGVISRNPVKKHTWEIFRETSKIEEKINAAFPEKEQASIRSTALEIAQLVGQNVRADTAKDAQQTEALIQLSLTLLLTLHWIISFEKPLILKIHLLLSSVMR